MIMNYSIGMSLGYKQHDMEHDLMGYKDAMCNSQKPAPAAEGDKKTTQESVDSYTGKPSTEDPYGW